MALSFFSRAKRFIKDDCGAAAVEYGVILLVVTAVGIPLFTDLGDEVEQNVSAACDGISGNATDCARPAAN